MLLLFAIPIIDKEVTAQEIIDNEALSENNDDNSDINKFVAKPQVNVNIQGTELDDKLRGGDGDDQIDGGKGDDLMDGGKGEDKLKGGKGADRFLCDMADKIIDYNSLENDKIVGQCKYEDKGLIPAEPIPKKGKNTKNIETNKPLFPNSFFSHNNDYSNTISEFFGIDNNQIFP